MATIQKISFRASSSNLLQQTKNVTNPPEKVVEQKQDVKKEDLPRQINKDKNGKSLAYVSLGVALASLGLTVAVVGKGKNSSKLGEEIRNLKDEVGKSLSDVSKDIGEKVNQKLTSVGENLTNLEQKVESSINIVKKGLDDKVEGLGKWQDGQIEGLHKKVDDKAKWNDACFQDLNDKIGHSKHTVLERNLAHIDNLKLAQNVDNDGKRVGLPDHLVKKLNNLAKIHIYKGVDHPVPKKLGPGSTVWSVAAEAVPEKEGGVGEVVMQMAVNMKKELGINNYVVKPLYEIKGRSKITQEGEKYTYFFDLDKAKKYEMSVNKVVEFDTNSFRNGRFEKQKVEVFSGVDPRTGYDTLLFKNSDYNATQGLYKNSQNVSEAERFAFFPKAVYEFIKLKMDPSSHTAYKIKNMEEYEKIKAPDAIYEHDWHVGALAVLMKAKAPVEAHFGELSHDAAENISKMCIDHLVHNADYQGASWQHSSEIINTLLDKYSFDIYEHLNSGFGHEGLHKVMTVGQGNDVNLANMGACLADFVEPVSSNYAHELSVQGQRSGALQHVFSERLSQGTMKGNGNGWDRSVNEVSINNLAGFNNNANNDKFLIIKEKLTSIKGISDHAKEEINTILRKGLSTNDLPSRLTELKELSIPELDSTIQKLEKQGLTTLRAYKPYTNKNTIEEIMMARKHNKEVFLDYLKSMLDYNKSNEKKLFNIIGLEHTDISNIKPEELDETPFISMGVRFVSQKGVDVASDTIKRVLKDWDMKYPGKKKPVFVIGGADGEGGNIKAIATSMKYHLGDSGKNVVYMDGYAPNNIFQSASDLTLSPSHFEPDGSLRESMYKGTPVGASRVGGQVNTVKDGVNGYLTKNTWSSSDDFVEVIDRFLVDFRDKEKYQKIVRATIDDEGSWVVKDKEGKIIGGALLRRLENLNFDLSKFPQIKLAE